VTITRDRDTAAAAKALAGCGLMDVSGPPLVVWVRSAATGTEHAIRSDGDLGMPGSAVCDAWLAQQAREHAVTLIAVNAYTVRHVCERAGITPAQLATRLQRLADDSRADVLLLDETVAPAEPPAAVPPPARGHAVVGAFRVGHVVEVPASEAHAIPHLIGPLGRDCTTVGFNRPDRFVAQRQASQSRSEHRTTGPQVTTPAAWLVDVVRAFEPRLLLVDSESVDRGGFDLDALAREHHVAIGVLAAPRDPGHVTPETLLKEMTT
jgi:hypothetical protein